MQTIDIDQLGLGRWKHHPIMKREDVTNILAFASDSDPTDNKSYFLWLIRVYDDNVSTSQLRQALRYFHAFKSKLTRRDIFEYTVESLLSTVDDILNPELVHIDSEECTILYDGPLGKLLIPKKLECIERLGGGTPWCISRRRNNEFHLYNHSLYIWKVNYREKYAFYFDLDTGMSEAVDVKGTSVNDAQIEYFRKEHPVLKQLFEYGEGLLLKTQNPQILCNYAASVLHGQWKEAEPFIFKNPAVMLDYIKYCVKKEHYPFNDNMRGVQPASYETKRIIN